MPRHYKRRYQMVPFQGELKHFDAGFVNQNITISGGVFELGAMAQNSSESGRIGTQVTYKSINLKFETVATGTTIDQRYEISLIWDAQPNAGPVPSIGEIYTNSTTILGFRQMCNRLRFKTIWTSGPFAIGGSSSQNLNQQSAFSMFKKVNLNTQFCGSGSGIANVNTGAIYLTVRSTALNIAASHGMSFFARFRYQDGRIRGNNFSGAAVVSGDGNSAKPSVKLGLKRRIRTGTVPSRKRRKL